MLKANTPIMFTVIALLICAPACVTAGKNVDLKNLPENVVKAIQDRLPGAQLLSAKEDKKDSKIEYEVKVRHDGKKYEVDLTEDGSIKEIDPEDD